MAKFWMIQTARFEIGIINTIFIYNSSFLDHSIILLYHFIKHLWLCNIHKCFLILKWKEMYEMLGIKSNFDDQTACGVFYLVCIQRISLQGIKKSNKINLVSFERPYSKFRVSSYSKHYVRSPIELSDSMYTYKYIMYTENCI